MSHSIVRTQFCVSTEAKSIAEVLSTGPISLDENVNPVQAEFACRGMCNRDISHCDAAYCVSYADFKCKLTKTLEFNFVK